MVSRLKGVMTKLIGPAQSSFIPGRLSTDNIVIVQEVVHSMRRKTGKKGWMLLKLDLEKAYDRIRWDYLEDTLRAASFSSVWVEWILQCVTGPSMSLLWNGEMTETFKPLRGLRQGDPLSPYLFVLCMERLCHQIEEEVESKRWKPISLVKSGPKLSHLCFADDLILFAEASLPQIRIIRRVLDRFCIASGQKVSLTKSKIFFSKNVSTNLAKLISEESGIEATVDLGRYLGMPVLHKRVNKDTFGSVVERVSSRLAGWKGRTLSFAGRLTLTKAVVCSIPVPSMSTLMLPASTLSKLDSLARDFLWGSTMEKRRQHFVAWDKVCLPKKDGGLGIRKAKDMNMALVAKIGWRLFQDQSSLWVKVLQSKYKVGEFLSYPWFDKKDNRSALWRSVVVAARVVLLQGHRWVLGDGKKVLFWLDKWVTNQPIDENVIQDVPAQMQFAKVSDFWEEATGWDFSRIDPHVTESIRLEMMSLVVDTSTGAVDRLIWGETAKGEFSVSSAYALLTRDATLTVNMSQFFDCIWKIRAPERVKTFLWLVSHQVIMTNKERHRRHLSDTDVCQVCKGGVESILHVLRDCPAMYGIWLRLVPRRKQRSFFQQSLFEWLFANLRDHGVVRGVPWATMFAISTWWGWKWRCMNVFGDNRLCRDRTQVIIDMGMEVVRAAVTSREEIEVERIDMLISWQAPTPSWLKLNTDGTSRGNPGLATAGGVLRDPNGNWIGGFAMNIGSCTAPLAELWGVYYGLRIAWEKRIERLEVEVDSKIVVDFLSGGIGESHPLSFLVRMCQGLLSKDWIVRISHVYREANRLADGLANYGFSLPFGLHFFDNVPLDFISILNENVLGQTRTRRLRM